MTTCVSLRTRMGTQQTRRVAAQGPIKHSKFSHTSAVRLGVLSNKAMPCFISVKSIDIREAVATFASREHPLQEGEEHLNARGGRACLVSGAEGQEVIKEVCRQTLELTDRDEQQAGGPPLKQ